MIGKRVAHYEIVEKLGEGGMGVVWKARDTELNRFVALKMQSAGETSDPDRRRRFVQEAQAASALNHPSIITIHDIVHEDGFDFFVMEYISGKALDRLIPGTGLPAEQALRYASMIASALARAHESGIVHRDLKPSNIMVDDRGQVKILDFGLAKLTEKVSSTGDDETATAELTQAGTVLGTVAYMSPEQAEGRRVDSRSDVFSFGSVLYEMLAGKRAFGGPSTAGVLAAVMRDDPKPIGEVRNDVPPEVRKILARCLKKNPAERYPSGTELSGDIENCREQLYPPSGSITAVGQIMRTARRPWFLAAALAVLAVMVGAASLAVNRYLDVRWARQQALPEIARLTEEGKTYEAYALAAKAEKFIANEPILQKQWPAISSTVCVETAPTGADIYIRNYTDPGQWQLLGKSPLKNLRVPRGFLVWKIEKPGFAPVSRVTLALFGAGPTGRAVASSSVSLVLEESSKAPKGMVRVEPEKWPKTLYIPGFEGQPELVLPAYWIDQFEVTNRQYKEFLDQGGYRKPEYWKQPFVKDGKELSWEQGIQLLIDATGRPGPKDWVQGEYPKSQDEFPVAGVSWYEAAAYAEYAGKTLPTIFHWNRAAGPFFASYIVPASNFGSSGMVAVGARRGLGPWGTVDMAGNVKEWVWNESDPGRRYVLGGAWDEPNYMFVDPDAQSAWTRIANIGFRCAKYVDVQSIPKAAFLSVTSPRRDFNKEKPVSDELFRAYRGIFSYDKGPLNAASEAWGKAEERWKAERITYAAAYSGEKAAAYLFLPKQGKPPFQTVVFFPGSNALLLRKFSSYPTASLDAIVRSGRAVLCPVYKGTFERGDGMESDVPNMTSTWRDHVAMWVKDVSRAIDYAETRSELDTKKLAYYGYSWGAAMGAIVPALETRIQVNVLALGGFCFQKALPEADQINFLSRVKQPTLMLSGRYDFFFPVEATQVPFYKILGTPAAQKKQIIYESGHNIPPNELIKEMLNWFDQYLGPVS